MTTRGVVLCGGEGRRLRPITDYVQKTMVPIGSKKRPLLEYVVRLLVWHRVKEITLLTGHMSEQIENYMGDGSRFGARITISRDSEKGLGSAGALANALNNGKIGKFDDLLVYYGDVLSNLNLTDLLRLHISKRAKVTLVLSRGFTMPVGVAKVIDGAVTSFEEKPTVGIDVTTGCMVVSSTAAEIIAGMTGKKDLMTHFVPRIIGEKASIFAFYAGGFWYDVGTTESYEKLSDSLVDTQLGFLG